MSYFLVSLSLSVAQQISDQITLAVVVVVVVCVRSTNLARKSAFHLKNAPLLGFQFEQGHLGLCTTQRTS